MERFLLDLRDAVRALGRRPALTLVVAGSLALAIGANTAVFSYLGFLLWAPLPVRDPDSLVTVAPETKEGVGMTSYPEYLDLKEQGSILAGLSASSMFTTPIGTGEGAVQVWGSIVSGNFFPLLGVEAFRGRALIPEDDRPGAEPAVVLSYRLWRRDFGSDPAVVGTILPVNGHPFRVAGIMPEGFAAGQVPSEIYLAISHWALVKTGTQNLVTDRDAPWLSLTGRLRPGVGRPTAEAALAAPYRGRKPETGPVGRVRVTPGGRVVDAETRRLMLPSAQRMMVFVLFLLLISCANVANLLLSGAVARTRDLGIRSSLGAGRRQLVQQLLTESVLLALLGGLLGTVFAVWGTRQIEGYLNTGTAGLGAWGEGWADLRLDWRVLGFTLVLCLVAGLASGLLPALRASARRDLVSTLKGGPGLGAGAARGSRLREVLVVLQAALAVWLIAGTCLFAQSLWRLYRTDPGFKETGKILLLTFLAPALPPGADLAPQRDEYQRIVAEAAELPGLVSSSLVWGPPLSGWARTTPVQPPEWTGEPAEVDFAIVEARYFETLGISLLQGRDFRRADPREGPAGVIVNQSLARLLWPGKPPLGRRLQVPDLAGSGTAETEVIGVVADSRSRSLWEKPRPLLYLPFQRYVRRQVTLVMRTAGEPASVAPLLRRELRRNHPQVAVVDLLTFSEHLDQSLTQQRMNAEIVGVFGALGLALAALGVGSAMSASVAQKSHEIGVRMALGADRRGVLWRVLGHALALAGLGAALGLLGTLASSRLLASFIEGMETVPELPVLAAAATLLLAVAAGASYRPARRAARIEPSSILKQG